MTPFDGAHVGLKRRLPVCPFNTSVFFWSLCFDSSICYCGESLFTCGLLCKAEEIRFSMKILYKIKGVIYDTNHCFIVIYFIKKTT